MSSLSANTPAPSRRGSSRTRSYLWAGCCPECTRTSRHTLVRACRNMPSLRRHFRRYLRRYLVRIAAHCCFTRASHRSSSRAAVAQETSEVKRPSAPRSASSDPPRPRQRQRPQSSLIDRGGRRIQPTGQPHSRFSRMHQPQHAPASTFACFVLRTNTTSWRTRPVPAPFQAFVPAPVSQPHPICASTSDGSHLTLGLHRFHAT